MHGSGIWDALGMFWRGPKFKNAVGVYQQAMSKKNRPLS